MIFRPFSYDVIVADPPWKFDLRSEAGEEKSAQAHYDCMDLEAIKGLQVDRIPVSDLARRGCSLFLWATCPMLPQALEVMKAWGFEYKSQMVWRKVTKNWKPSMGPGYIVRTLHEPILIGTMGEGPGKVGLPSLFEALFEGERREHSRKPDVFFDLIREKMPKTYRLNLFSAGHEHEGFDGWGEPHAERKGAA